MAIRLPPLNGLRAFEAAARHLSFQKAAEELHVTPAAISHQVKGLEEHLGVQLFRRGNRALELTDAARLCLPKLQEGFDCLREAVERLLSEKDTTTLEVRVAPSLAAKWLMPRLHRFISAHPDIDVRIAADSQLIDVSERSSAGKEHGTPAGDADLCIRFGAGHYFGYRVDKLFDVSLLPMCSPKLLEGEHPLRTPDDLRHHTLLHDDVVYFDRGASNWEVWLEAADVKNVDAARGAHFNHTALALEAAADGSGVVLATPVVAAADLASGRLVRPFALSLPSDFAYYAISPETRADAPAVARFREWLFEEANVNRGDEPRPARSRKSRHA